jgi:hypothetical protein
MLFLHHVLVAGQELTVCPKFFGRKDTQLFSSLFIEMDPSLGLSITILLE